jgi:hypothetical protein
VSRQGGGSLGGGGGVSPTGKLAGLQNRYPRDSDLIQLEMELLGRSYEEFQLVNVYDETMMAPSCLDDSRV